MPTQALVRVTAEQYLRDEARNAIRHEFVRGRLFEKAGGTDTHNTISLNIASTLRARLRSGPCRVFMADMKVHIAAADVFYYPDVFVTCDSGDKERYFKERACLIVEVLSETTEGTDRREKFLAYEQLESLKEYVLVQQNRRELEVLRRESSSSAWARSTHAHEGEVALSSVSVSLTLAEIYEGLDLS